MLANHPDWPILRHAVTSSESGRLREQAKRWMPRDGMDARAVAKDEVPGRTVIRLAPRDRGGRRARGPASVTTGSADLSDAGLVRAAQQTPATFSVLYERYFEIVYAYCQRRLDDRPAAEDATAAIFSRAFASLDTCRHPRPLPKLAVHDRAPRDHGPLPHAAASCPSRFGCSYAARSRPVAGRHGYCRRRTAGGPRRARSAAG